MKSSKQFHNIFIPNKKSRISPISSQFQSSINQSQYFEDNQNNKRSEYQYSTMPIYLDQNMSQTSKNGRDSRIFNQQNLRKETSVLQRAKSQIISSVYMSPYKRDFTEELNQSNCLASSNASQITFAKPSQFITNTKKQSFYMISTQKSTPQHKESVNNDYGYFSNKVSFSNSNEQNHSLNIKSPMTSSFITNYNNPIKNSLISNKNQSDRRHNFIDTPMFQSQIITMRPLKTTVVFKNQPQDFKTKPQLKRALSNISIMSQKSTKTFSATKVNFNYTSPSKSQIKKPRKLSFRKQDVKNPLNKLAKKKQSSKIKVNQQIQINLNNQVVNQYFPDFKVKKNKMLKNVISQPKRPSSKLKKNESLSAEIIKKDEDLIRAQEVRKQIELQLSLVKRINKPLEQTKQNIPVDKKNQFSPIVKIQKNENIEEDGGKNHTFIAGLDGFSQISQIKIRQKEDSIQITNDTPKKTPLFQFGNDDTLRLKFETQKINKISGYRITLSGEMVPLSGSTNQIFHNVDHQISDIQKDSQVSIPSHDLNLSKKQQNNSSKTTDYEQEMVRKLKQELGLNFSYYKK